MAMQRFMNPRLPVMLTGSLIALYACSFQDFAHLQGGAGEGSAGLGNGGTSSSGGVAGRGGDAGSSGSAAGLTEPGGGSPGEEGGRGGEGGEGAQPEGGEAGDGGAAKGGTQATGGAGAGGTSATGGGAGEPNETGGTAGLGGLGGTSGMGGMAGTGGNPPLVGNLLVNGGFQSGLSGWTVDPPTATSSRHAYTQTPNPPNGTSSSLATWHQTQEYTVTISQTVTGLEPGNYTFSAFVSTQRSQQTYLFARNCGGEELKLDIPLISFEWQPYEIAVEVTGTSCEVGLFVHNVPEDWVNADEFSFEKDP